MLGGPDFSKLKKASTPVSYATSYSSGGFLAFSYFTDDQCTEAMFTTGFPVNTCFIEVGYAYMVRLAKGTIFLYFCLASFSSSYRKLLFIALFPTA
jgi:hypothetical protein